MYSISKKKHTFEELKATIEMEILDVSEETFRKLLANLIMRIRIRSIFY